MAALYYLYQYGAGECRRIQRGLCRGITMICTSTALYSIVLCCRDAVHVYCRGVRNFRNVATIRGTQGNVVLIYAHKKSASFPAYVFMKLALSACQFVPVTCSDCHPDRSRNM